MLALLAILAWGPAERAEMSVEVPLYLGADIDEKVLATALREVDRIFERGDIRLRFVVSPDADDANPFVTVVLQPRPVRPIIHGCSRNLHDHRLGRTSFRARRITLWSEQIARAVDGDWDAVRTPNVADRVYARALGRVLAHELGHFFLSLNGHRDNGLMRPSFSHRSLSARGSRGFRMSERDLGKMRAALEQATRLDADASF